MMFGTLEGIKQCHFPFGYIPFICLLKLFMIIFASRLIMTTHIEFTSETLGILKKERHVHPIPLVRRRLQAAVAKKPWPVQSEDSLIGGHL
jgi:hypothetical protein